MSRKPVVDFHAHILEPVALEQARNKTVLTGFGTRKANHTPAMGSIQATMEKMLNPARQIEDMDRIGVDINVISSSTVIAGTSWAEIKHEIELIRRINDRAAEWCSLFPKRFVGSFVLPLRDVDLSLKEMDRAVNSLNLKIANVSSCYNNCYLGHPSFHPFWEAAEAAGVIVFIHPEGTPDLWFQDFSLWNSVGQPIEEAKVMASIIYEGIFERFPKIRIVMAHGGGYLPHYFGRLDRNVTNMPDSIKNIKCKPSDYLSKFYYDTCTYNSDTMASLIAKVGVDRIVMGSDYAVGDPDPIKSIAQIPNLSETDRDKIVSTNSVQLLF